jgi:hypothetical protein
VGSGQDTGAVGHASEREKTGIGYCSPPGRHARYARMTGWLAALASRGPSDCSLLAGISESLARGPGELPVNGQRVIEGAQARPSYRLLTASESTMEARPCGSASSPSPPSAAWARKVLHSRYAPEELIVSNQCKTRRYRNILSEDPAFSDRA